MSRTALHPERTSTTSYRIQKYELQQKNASLVVKEVRWQKSSAVSPHDKKVPGSIHKQEKVKTCEKKSQLCHVINLRSHLGSFSSSLVQIGILQIHLFTHSTVQTLGQINYGEKCGRLVRTDLYVDFRLLLNLIIC